MYKINRIGECVGFAESLTYIKRAKNGCYVLCPEPDASGIVFGGTVYHLQGRAELPDVDTVSLEEVDAGTELMAARTAAMDADAMSVDHEYRLTLLEQGLTVSDNN